MQKKRRWRNYVSSSELRDELDFMIQRNDDTIGKEEFLNVCKMKNSEFRLNFVQIKTSSEIGWNLKSVW